MTAFALVAVALLAATTGPNKADAARLLLSSAACADVEGWHDHRGEANDCAYWESWCESGWSSFDSYAGEDGLTPDQACCACGGGGTAAADVDDETAALSGPLGGGASSSPGNEPLAVAEGETSVVCVDEEGWHDHRGESKDCDYWSTYCESGWSSFDSYAGEDGLTPDQACCACGGGGGAQSPTEALEGESQLATDEEQPSLETCVDVDGWHDNRGESTDCDYWESWCGKSSYSSWEDYLSYQGEGGLYPFEACCACGGGLDSPALLAATAPVDESCVSHEGWHDDRGPEYDCSHWAQHCTPGGTYVNWSKNWGCFDDYPGTAGLTPDQACCECGGGVGQGDDPASASWECTLKKLSDEEALAEAAADYVGMTAFLATLSFLG